MDKDVKLRPIYLIDMLKERNDEDYYLTTSQLRAILNDYVNFNIYDVLSEAYYNVRAEMTPAEKKQLYDRYIKPMHLTKDKDGEVRVELGE